MGAITCSCGQVIIEQPDLLPAIMPNACPDCDPEGYPLRWSCPLPPRDPGNNLAYLRRRVEVLEGRLDFMSAIFSRTCEHLPYLPDLNEAFELAHRSVEESMDRGPLNP